MAIKIIIDSASDVDIKEAESLGISMIPMEVSFLDEEYLDDVTLTPSEFYNKLVSSSALPKTSLINSYRFEEEYDKIVSNGDEAIVITISSKLSGTYSSAREASLKYPNKIEVVDSLNACMGERLLMQYAMLLISQGCTLKEIKKKIDAKKSKVRLFAVLDTLKFLQKGGRISTAVAVAGTLFSIKPIVGVVDGEVKMVGKAIGTKKANTVLNDLVEKCGGIDYSMPYGVVWSGNDDKLLQRYLLDSTHLWAGHCKISNIPSHIIGCTIGTHVGPGAFGIAFFEK